MFSFSSSLQGFPSYSIPAFSAIPGYPYRKPREGVSTAVPAQQKAGVFPAGPVKGRTRETLFFGGFGRHASGAYFSVPAAAT
ncbi:hypothetical protein [Arthrobacter sp. zg-Y40]|uniref:hypothetical protein n=1 Tax=Arthrobacter sp. zg-Y40 TaxID=2886939 RepID=UPI001D14A379|nr:hypothetical protein [Arthrobacter sp. zg-Y40]